MIVLQSHTQVMGRLNSYCSAWNPPYISKKMILDEVRKRDYIKEYEV